MKVNERKIFRTPVTAMILMIAGLCQMIGDVGMAVCVGVALYGAAVIFDQIIS